MQQIRRRIAIIISLAFLIQTHAEELTAKDYNVISDVQDPTGNSADMLVDEVVDNLFSRVLAVAPLDHADLDSLTLGKPGQLASSSRTSLRLLQPPHAHSPSTRGSAALGDYPLQLRRIPTPYNHVGRDSLQRNVLAAAQPLPAFKDFFDDKKKSVKDQLGGEVDQDTEKRIEEGNMNFVDFLKALDMINKLRGMQGVLKYVPGMNKVMPSEEQMEEARRKSKRFTKIVQEGMTEEERQNPDLVCPKSTKDASKDERIKEIAEATEFDIEGVKQFFTEFTVMRLMMSRMAKGESAEDIEKDMMEQDLIPEGNRKARRQREQAETRAQKKKAVSGGGFR